MFQFKFRRRYFYIILILAIVVTVLIDIIRISSYKSYPLKPIEEFETFQDEVYQELSDRKLDIDWSRLDGTLQYIENQYDCSDFRLVNLLRIVYEYGDLIPDSLKLKIDNTLLNFRYWWDEPGGNSMCYWSENHQILFASAEYLVGQKYPDRIFFNSGLNGQEHLEKARKRIIDWMEMRWKYGFTEFYSSVYYKEDIGGMINLIDFADEEISKKMQIIMDLLLFDVASQNVKTMFISVSGRAYERNRKGGGNLTLGGITNYYWGNGEKIEPNIMYGMMTTQKYILPPVIAEIGMDTNSVVIKQTNGLDISELKNESFSGTDTRSMMMQWGMESFSYPELIRNSLYFIRKNGLFSNGFLNSFKSLDYSILRWFHLEPLLMKFLNPQSNGFAIQKGNTYTFKTNDYSLYSVQNYHPGTYGDQQHVVGMNVGNSFSIFHTHPACEKGVKNHSPNYWVGYGHLPHVAQDGNVSLAIYHIPAKKGFGEAALLDFTHAYFPKEQFDTVIVKNNFAFGQKGNTYCAFIGNNVLKFRENTTDDLIQKGKRTYWITVAGSKNDNDSFSQFIQSVQNYKIEFDIENLVLTCNTGVKNCQLTYNGDFVSDSKIINTNYKRFDSPFCQADKKADSITIGYHEKTLQLDFEKMIRRF